MHIIEFDFETLLRFAIPGSILLLPLWLIAEENQWLPKAESNTFILLFGVFVVGFVVHH